MAWADINITSGHSSYHRPLNMGLGIIRPQDIKHSPWLYHHHWPIHGSQWLYGSWASTWSQEVTTDHSPQHGSWGSKTWGHQWGRILVFIVAWDNSMNYQHLHDLRWCCGPRWSFEKVQSLFLDSGNDGIAQSQGSPEARPQVWVLSLCLLKLQAVVHHPANPVGQWQHVDLSSFTCHHYQRLQFCLSS